MGLRRRLGAALRRERARLGWTQAEAAEAAGLDVRHWQKLEVAEVAATLDTLEQICLALGIDAVELLQIAPPPRKPRRRKRTKPAE